MTVNNVNGAGPLVSLIHSDGDFGGDVNAQVAAMVLEHARDMRHGADQAKAAEEQQIEANEAAQVAAMHAQADDIRASAKLNALGGVLEGGFKMASGFVSMPSDKGPSQATLQTLTAKGNVLQGIGDAGGAALNGLGAAEQGAAKDADGDSTAATHRADAAKRRLDDAKQLADDARDLLRQSLDFLRETSRTKADTEQGALKIRG